jgi:hypothetical protein
MNCGEAVRLWLGGSKLGMDTKASQELPQVI